MNLRDHSTLFVFLMLATDKKFFIIEDMTVNLERAYISEHSPDDVWKAINTPLVPELGEVASDIQPWLRFSYERLDDEGLIQAGTCIIGVPTQALVELVPGPFRSKIPQDMELVVSDHSPETRTRTDSLESEKRSGTVRYEVKEGADGSGLLVVEGEISLAGMESMFEAQFAEHGVYLPAGRTLDHAPELIAGHP